MSPVQYWFIRRRTPIGHLSRTAILSSWRASGTVLHDLDPISTLLLLRKYVLCFETWICGGGLHGALPRAQYM